MTGKKRQTSPPKDLSLDHLKHQRVVIKNNITRIKTGLEEKTFSLNPNRIGMSVGYIKFKY